MIWEIYQYYTTPVMPLARKMGFLEEAISMAARRNRCRTQWDAHFQHCQKAIRQACELATKKRQVVIFGAGSLLDIPLAYLAETFEKVWLVDLVFLKAARKLVKPYANIECVEQDVTDTLEGVLKGEKKVKTPQAWLDLEGVDCVVSLNLISQLPLIPVKWLLKYHAITEMEAEGFGQALIRNHLAYLNQFSGVKCLIADRVNREFDAQGELLEEFDSAWEVPLPEASQTWEWTLIPLAETKGHRIQKNQVGVSTWF